MALNYLKCKLLLWNKVLGICCPYNYLFLQRKKLISDQNYVTILDRYKASFIKRSPFCLRSPYNNCLYPTSNLFNMFLNSFIIISDKPFPRYAVRRPITVERFPETLSKSANFYYFCTKKFSGNVFCWSIKPTIIIV